MSRTYIVSFSGGGDEHGYIELTEPQRKYWIRRKKKVDDLLFDEDHKHDPQYNFLTDRVLENDFDFIGLYVDEYLEFSVVEVLDNGDKLVLIDDTNVLEEIDKFGETKEEYEDWGGKNNFVCVAQPFSNESFEFKITIFEGDFNLKHLHLVKLRGHNGLDYLKSCYYEIGNFGPSGDFGSSGTIGTELFYP
jgi:hypothetical protein